jgi:uncharacterized protein
MTAPVQPGNSGGPLFDQSGNIVGVIVGKLDAVAVARATGDIPQNVNFAIHAYAARVFLDAHAVEYNTARFDRSVSVADIVDRATKFTLLVECLK